MDVARGDQRHPRRAHRDAGLLAARVQPGPRRRLPGRVQHPRPRLGQARPLLARDHGEDARVGAGDRRRQRLPGRHARGAGDPRPQQGRRPRDLDGRHRPDDQRRDRRRAHRQVQGQGPPLRHPRAAALAAAPAAGGHRPAAGAHRERRRRAPGRHRADRAAADPADDHAPRPRARDHDHRQRRARGLAVRRHRPLDGDRARRTCRTTTASSPPAPPAPSTSRSSRCSSRWCSA